MGAYDHDIVVYLSQGLDVERPVARGHIESRLKAQAIGRWGKNVELPRRLIVSYQYPVGMLG